MNYNNIPEELRTLNQWCVWKYVDVGSEKPTKEPFYTPTKHMSVNDPSTWLAFDIAVDLQREGKFDGIGFVFTNDDKYAGIDLDDAKGDQIILNRQIEIYREFDSYSERSPSKTGLHIIVEGSVIAGRKRNSIEIYSSGRFFTFTGDVYNNKPIRNCQDQLMRLWQQMGSGNSSAHTISHDEPEKYSDQEIIEQASRASNGNKFDKLFNGQWQDVYPHIAAAGQGPSEADQALINMLAFYTKNRDQIKRLFYVSGLGKRTKVRRSDYVERMVLNAFDRMLPPIDFDGFRNQLEMKLAIVAKPVPIAISQETTTVVTPPGLLGEIAQFIYSAAPRPVPEIAIAGAIGLMAGICGRAYNISGTGLNQYVLMLAKTGRGKESIASGIDKLMNTIRTTVPTSARFRGPGIINSGQALTKHLSTTSNCFVSVLGEFGLTIDRISSPFANSADKMLYQMLLDLYNKSGYGQTLQPSIYSKKEENTSVVDSPAVTILGESNPKIFYDILNEGMIAAGLLPRFLIIEYHGDRVATNDNHHLVQPAFLLSEKFGSLIAYVETILGNRNNNPNTKRVVDVEYDEKAFKMLKDFDKYADWKINSAKDDVVEELWNRAHMKALRLSALVAVGVNMISPRIMPDHAEWALQLVNTDIKALSSKFEAGEVGTNTLEIRQITEAIRIIKEFVTKNWEHVNKYIDVKKMHDEKIIPYLYFSKRLANNVAFKSDRIGATNSIKRAIQTLIDRDSIREMTKNDAGTKFGTSQKCYVVSSTKLLD